jgi:hypothetical protein
VRVFTIPFTLLLAGGVGVASSCQQNLSASIPADASLDQSVPECVTSKDCPSGSCAYPPLVGCSAKGECRSFEPPDSDTCTTPATTACGCDGKTVDIPPCWNGFAPAPILATPELTCADAK